MWNDKKIKPITVKFSEEEHEFIEKQGSKSRYIRSLIQREMNPPGTIGEIKSMLERMISSNNPTVTEKVITKLTTKPAKNVDVTSAIDDMFDMK